MKLVHEISLISNCFQNAVTQATNQQQPSPYNQIVHQQPLYPQTAQYTQSGLNSSYHHFSSTNQLSSVTSSMQANGSISQPPTRNIYPSSLAGQQQQVAYSAAPVAPVGYQHQPHLQSNPPQSSENPQAGTEVKPTTSNVVQQPTSTPTTAATEPIHN